MKLAIMQPYILPYIGYFQLIQSVDLFLVCDNLQYTKKGWINRNRILQNGRDAFFTLPLKHAPQSAHIADRHLAPDFHADHLLKQFTIAYQRSRYFEETFPLLQRIFLHNDLNLFNFNLNSITEVCNHLGIQTRIGKTSDAPINHDLKKEDKVLALCHAMGAQTYINSIGGRELYDKERFNQNGVSLNVLETTQIQYKQFNSEFIPWLSMVDLLMFNPLENVKKWTSSNYHLV